MSFLGRRILGPWFVFAIVFSIAAPGFSAPASLLLGARAGVAGQDDVEDEVAKIGGSAAPEIHARRESIRPANLAAALNHLAAPASRRALASITAIGSPPQLSVLLCRYNC